MPERLNGAVSKTVELILGSEGSNPSLSAIIGILPNLVFSYGSELIDEF